MALGSHDTALCIIPPRHLWPRFDRLRALYDKGYGKWPPHINLVYPAVQIDALPKALEALQQHLAGTAKPQLCLNSADSFQHRHGNTVFVQDDRQGKGELRNLRKAALASLGHGQLEEQDTYHMHLTVGQTEEDDSWHKYLLQKANMLPAVEWEVDQLYILVRERDGDSSQMKAWATISLLDGTSERLEPPLMFYESLDSDATACVPYAYGGDGSWASSTSNHQSVAMPERLAVATYNVLAEFYYPPSQERYPLLVQNMLSDRGRSDVLVLQEVTDDFLSYLLRHRDIRDSFSFVSHGPPDQKDVDPLPSHNNIVILSRFAFDWEWVPFKREHKGSVVVKFRDIGQWDDTDFSPLIMATVHLTCGLKDGAITAKKAEIQRIFKYLATTYPDHPIILTGDFNISTSSYTISQALKKDAISSQAADQLEGLESGFTKEDFVDTWIMSQLERGTDSDEDLVEAFEGEQGATYDPTVNGLAAKIVGSGFNVRPQRYDRILVRGDDFFQILNFNKFGFMTEEVALVEGKAPGTLYASDHWGIRAIFRLGHQPTERASIQEATVNLKRASGELANTIAISDILTQLQAIPSEQEAEERSTAFELLKSVILETSSGSDASSQSRLKSPLLVVPVGSYGLGTWTPSSDIDTLCIGPFSSKTFFALVTQRLRKAAHKDIRILRRVKAQSGLMLELEIQGIKFDLQYCPATTVAELWPGVLRVPASDPVWTLPVQTLLKIKAIRDLDYLRRSIPDYTKFRLAYRLVKTWAKSRGIYTAKYGYLGGVQVSILLACVYKLLARDATPVSVSDILVTFFNHYASFDFEANLVFDPFFHRQQLNYRRTTREPLAILGYFAPALNTSSAASVPSVRTIAAEFRRADRLLSEGGMTWSEFLEISDAASGAADFLHSYLSYVKLDIQFWGGSLAKGSSFVGWLESRCVMVLVDMNRRLPNLQARFWPARFVESTTAADEGQDYYQGCYLIGLDKLDEKMSKDDLKAAFDNLQTLLGRFTEQIRGDETYFDANTSWMTANVVKKSELGPLKIDERDWGQYTANEEESSDEEENEELEDSLDEQEFGPSVSKKKGGKRQIIVRKPEGAGKLRTAVDVMNRLRWDPSLDSEDYIVGYEDRFVGAQERALGAWKTEQTDEEFIPQHRILYYKRKSDGVVVWEKKTRKDHIFGSGA